MIQQSCLGETTTCPRTARAWGVSPLLQSAQRALGASGYPPLWKIECKCVDGVFTLRGRVSTYYLKQLAQVSVQRTAAGYAIENLIEVVTPASRLPR